MSGTADALPRTTTASKHTSHSIEDGALCQHVCVDSWWTSKADGGPGILCSLQQLLTPDLLAPPPHAGTWADEVEEEEERLNKGA